jgi:hypothetical protein
MQRLVHDPDPFVVQSLAMNANCPRDVLRALIDHPDDNVRAAVAANRSTPVDLQRHLLAGAMAGRRHRRDQQSRVIGALARNPNVDPHLLSDLVLNPSCPEWVLEHGLANPACSPDTMRRALDHSSGATRLVAAANNPHIPPDVAMTVSKLDPARYRPALINLVTNPNCPSETLAHLACTGPVFIRLRVVQHHRTPPEVLVQLAGDKAVSVRRQVAKHPNTPGGVLIRLLADEDEEVRGTALKNPNLPDEYRVLCQVT